MKWALPVFATFVFLASIANASPTLSFSSPDDLGNITIGQPVTVRVVLSNLPSGDELESLAATVTFDGSLLGAPTSITGGPILPSPLNDPLDFVTASSYGLADGNFLTSGTTSADRIMANGTFFTFTLTAQTVGTGQVTFNFVDALQHNSANPSQPIDPGLTAGPALPFTVVIPEPATASLLIVGALHLTLSRRRH